MCGIFGYQGSQGALSLLVEGLRNLEYRGYDAAGVAIVSHKTKQVYLEKSVGKVSQLASRIDTQYEDNGEYTTGIAHTRWATHGEVSLENTHPHVSQNKRFYVVHNGIIENFGELKKELEKKYRFYSQTDSEIIAKLFEDLFTGNMRETLEKVSQKLVGAYACVVLDRENPNKLLAVKIGSPLIIGNSNSGVFLSSDVNALSKYCHEFCPLEDGELVVISNKNFHIYALQGEQVEREPEKMDQEYLSSGKGNFEYFTQKEIYEIPHIIRDSLKGRIDFEKKEITNETLLSLAESDFENIEFIASGSSYFAAQVGSYWFKKYTHINVGLHGSSEFIYDDIRIFPKTLYVFLSQSGETADTLEGVKLVKTKGGHTFGIINVPGSSIARLTDQGLFCRSGVEVGVASTKNVIAQYVILLLLALAFGIKKDLDYTLYSSILDELFTLPEKIQHFITHASNIKKIAQKYAYYSHFFYLGRNICFPVAGECSLKLKELSYIHSEAYSSGELKHGALSLITSDFPTIVLNPSGKLSKKTRSNVEEIRARKGKVVGIISEGDMHIDMYNDVIFLPRTSFDIAPFPAAVAGQLFAFYLAQELGREIDKPRNLAKSVTVE